MTSFRADRTRAGGPSLRLCAALTFGMAGFGLLLSGAKADILGTMPAGRVVTPGTITTTGPDGTVTQTLPAPDGSSAPSGAGAAPAPASGPQQILPPGFGATSINTDAAPAQTQPFSAPSFPGGEQPTGAERTRIIADVPGRTGSGITMSRLGGVDASAAGLADAKLAGFGSNMWAGATRTDVDHYLSLMPVMTRSPIVNELGRRLLITGAEPPQGQVAGQLAGPGQTGGMSLLAIRMDRLIASGRADLASQLGQNTLADKAPAVALTRARAALALGKDDLACQELSNLPAGNDPAHDEGDAYATRLSAFCQILAGNHAAANLTLDLAREEVYDNPLFYSLAAEANDGLKLKAPDPKSLDALDLRFYALAKRPLPDDAGLIAVPASTATLARDKTLSPQIRLEAGERAALAGDFEGTELAALYKAQPFKSADIEGVKTGVFPKSSSLRRAVLFQAIDAEVMPTDRAGLMKQFLATCETGGFYLACVKALQPALTALPLGPELKDFAPAATRAFLIAGDRDAAARWFALINNGGPAFGRNLRELSALMRVSDPAGLKPMSEVLAGEIVSDLKSGVPDTQNFAATEAMIFDASGQTLPQNVLEALVSAPRSTGAPEQMLNQLHNAGLKGSVGEVVLLSLVAIGPGGPESADRQAVAQSVSSLRAVHLDREARRLALEALLGRSHAGRG
jgi:hypothetical protein